MSFDGLSIDDIEGQKLEEQLDKELEKQAKAKMKQKPAPPPPALKPVKAEKEDVSMAKARSAKRLGQLQQIRLYLDNFSDKIKPLFKSHDRLSDDEIQAELDNCEAHLSYGSSLDAAKSGYMLMLSGVERYTKQEGLLDIAAANKDKLDPLLVEFAIKYHRYLSTSVECRLLMCTFDMFLQLKLMKQLARQMQTKSDDL